MRVIPVLDVQGGVAVHAVAGRRHEYRPLTSRLTSATDPVEVARAFRAHLACPELYLADLDAICRGYRNPFLYQSLVEIGLSLWLDAGVRSAEDAVELAALPLAKIVLGLETLRGPEVVAEIAGRFDWDRLVFSLDLRNGEPICSPTWPTRDALEILSLVRRFGIETVILLDLARVGTGSGFGTETLCRNARQCWPNLHIVLGGGIRGPEDLKRAKECGADAVLVASALHDGRLTRADLEAVSRSS
ncbi:MAG: HisA/HisF-related TIM barrel protein [Gemmatales bacterium]|nr:HisA/HisF-related TIM barrel protein [Gemmatales bacterium]MDW8388157.1 HisA/HisF-related TIM barrel protein [Gemmatales bacterium]